MFLTHSQVTGFFWEISCGFGGGFCFLVLVDGFWLLSCGFCFSFFLLFLVVFRAEEATGQHHFGVGESTTHFRLPILVVGLNRMLTERATDLVLTHGNMGGDGGVLFVEALERLLQEDPGQALELDDLGVCPLMFAAAGGHLEARDSPVESDQKTKQTTRQPENAGNHTRKPPGHHQSASNSCWRILEGTG